MFLPRFFVWNLPSKEERDGCRVMTGTRFNTVVSILCVLPICHTAQQLSREGKKSFSAICAVGRNENKYLREWAEHHLCLGKDSAMQGGEDNHKVSQFEAPRAMC